jgi:Tol biopolymer transport system component
LVQLTHDLAFEGFYPFLSWSPDGKQIVFEAMKTGDHSAIFVLDVGDPDSSTRSLGEGMFPAWSPDGAWIAFHRYGDLWIIRPDGLEAHRLSMQLCITGIAWSPDSQRIAFLEKDCGASGPAPLSLRSIRLEGGEISILYTFDKPGHGGELAWRTDGWQIACHCVLGNEEGNWLFDANGSGQPQRIDAIPISWFSNFWPQWSKR